MTPKIAVVGHPNKGKSSIVATLAEDDAVAISALPGTTTRARRYPLKVDGRVLYELIDTPGFQRPRETLAWLEAHHPAAHERADTVAEFVASERDNARFHDECELLSPLIEGAGVLYVVDGSKPYGPEFEAEMQVLRWTGRPRLALINLIGEGDYVDEWRRALDQFFAIARVFDATRADFSKRIELLRGFGELSEEWREPMNDAVRCLLTERAHRVDQSAGQIADLVLDVVTCRVSAELDPEQSERDGSLEQQKLTDRLLQKIRDRESAARDMVQSVYRHAGVSRREGDANFLSNDPFSKEAWQVFGLTRTQMATTGAVSGAIAGGGVDLVLGGASLLLGAGIGAVVGGVGGFLGVGRLAKTKVLGLPLGGRELIVGPIRDPNLAYVILGRAVRHQHLVAERNHAKREALIVDDTLASGVAADLDTDARRAFDRLITNARDRDVVEASDRDALRDIIRPLLAP